MGETPLSEGTIEEGGGVCINKFKRSISPGRKSHIAENPPREPLRTCGESKWWRLVGGDQQQTVGEQNLFALSYQ